MDVDPIASLRATDTLIVLGGREHRVPAAHAVRWLEILLESDISLDASEIIPGMLGDEAADEIEDMLLRGELSGTEVTEVALEVITCVAGRPWWWAVNLLMVTRSRWAQLYGSLLLQGVNVQQMPLGAVLDSLYALLIRNADQKKRQEIDRLLETSPTGELPELNEEAEGATFLAMANSGFA